MTTAARHSMLKMTTLAAVTLLASLGISIVSVALPALVLAFSAPLHEVQWVVLAYLISVTVAIVAAGRLGDLHGHRRVLIAGLAIFVAASAFCAMAPSLGVLVASRALQGIGGAVLMALPVSIARDVVSRDRIGSAMGLLGTMSAIGTALGPSVGGLLVAGLGWRAAFFLLAALGAAALALSLAAIPSEPRRDSRPRRAMDWWGAVLLAVALTAYALATSGGKIGLALGAALPVAIAALALAAFVVAEKRSTSPLVPLSVVADRATATALALNLLVATIMMSTLVVGPFFLSFGLHLNDAMVGLVLAVGPVIGAVAGVPAGRLADRFGAPRMLLAGLAEIVLGLACLAMLPRSFGAAGYVIALMVLTPGFQMFLAANNTAVMASAREDQRGILSGLLGMSRNLGFMTGASAMAMLFATAIGPTDISGASDEAVADAFTTTFLAAAGLALAALALALLGQRVARNSGTDDVQSLPVK